MPLTPDTRSAILHSASPYFTHQVATVFLDVVDRVPVVSTSTFWMLTQDQNDPQLRLYQLGAGAVYVFAMTNKAIDVETVALTAIHRTSLSITGGSIRLALFSADHDKPSLEVRGPNPAVNRPLFDAIRVFGEHISVAVGRRVA